MDTSLFVLLETTSDTRRGTGNPPNYSFNLYNVHGPDTDGKVAVAVRHSHLEVYTEKRDTC